MEFRDISKNFSIVKFLSILMVLTGHFFPGTDLWVPTTVGLFVFGFSSSYFTAAKYSGNFSVRKFWLKKIDRLAYNWVVINLFLFILLMAKGEKNLFSWYTVVSLLGLTGFLNWFKIPNKTPLGLGLWFFTLLLIFYALYPLLSFINRSKVRAFIFMSLSIIILTVLHFTVPMGHMLWMSSIAFILGQFLYLYRFSLSPKVAVGIGVFSIIIMVALNYGLKIKYFNYFLILIFSLTVVMFLLGYKIPRVLNILLIFSGCILEIYLISPYLTMKFNSLPTYVNYFFSLFLTLFTALVLNYLANKLRMLLAYIMYRYKKRYEYEVKGVHLLDS